jgi:hypothetical protein
MRSARLGPMLRTFWKVRRVILKTTGGRLVSRLGGMQVLMLETTGRTSGRPRSVERFVRADDPYGVYRDRMSRQIPVVELRPEES